MKNWFRAPAFLLFSLSLGLGLAAVAGPAAAQAPHYVCDPCGNPCDETVYDKPGTCPKCGMPLVDQEAARRAKERAARTAKKVAVLIFNGVQIIDSTGPYEVFGAAGFDVYTVAETKAPVTTSMGMTFVPRYAFADAPQPDVLVVPGGGVREARDSRATLEWIRKTTARAERTMSVCNGAFILASAGLLDGLTATTTAGQIDRLRQEYPKTKVVDDRRFVDNGKIITTAGLSSGIDGALHVVSTMLGNGTAQAVALAEEYDWRPQSGFARAALADRRIPRLDFEAMGNWEMSRTQGGTDRWDMVLHGTSQLAAAQLAARIGQALEAGGKWGRAGAGQGSSSPLASEWRFRGPDGKPWTGTLRVEEAAGQSHIYTVSLSVARAG